MNMQDEVPEKYFRLMYDGFFPAVGIVGFMIGAYQMITYNILSGICILFTVLLIFEYRRRAKANEDAVSTMGCKQ